VFSVWDAFGEPVVPDRNEPPALLLDPTVLLPGIFGRFPYLFGGRIVSAPVHHKPILEYKAEITLVAAPEEEVGDLLHFVKHPFRTLTAWTLGAEKDDLGVEG
jgi:hypothetical protein